MLMDMTVWFIEVTAKVKVSQIYVEKKFITMFGEDVILFMTKRKKKLDARDIIERNIGQIEAKQKELPN
jgi:hypothetical protein